MKNIYIVTGGSGFIGSNLVSKLIKDKNNYVVNIDKLTYASNEDFLTHKRHSNYKFIKADIGNDKRIKSILAKYKPNFIIHLAAESHVDRSIDNPKNFILTNILGTYNLLNESYNYWKFLKGSKKLKFRFIMVSTDEVYGSLKSGEMKFTENNVYSPNSPYAASKASADMISRAWFKTYKFPLIITNTCNNYGPWQFPEKLIPLTLSKCIKKQIIPVFGKGNQIRDWIHVDDHVNGLIHILNKGKLGEKYNIGSNNEIKNINVVRAICDIFDKISQTKGKKSNKLIRFVKDRPGHDTRYAIDTSKISKLGWKPEVNWKKGLTNTIGWYLGNTKYLKRIEENTYSGKRLGVIKK